MDSKTHEHIWSAEPITGVICTICGALSKDTPTPREEHEEYCDQHLVCSRCGRKYCSTCGVYEHFTSEHNGATPREDGLRGRIEGILRPDVFLFKPTAQAERQLLVTALLTLIEEEKKRAVAQRDQEILASIEKWKTQGRDSHDLWAMENWLSGSSPLTP